MLPYLPGDQARLQLEEGAHSQRAEMFAVALVEEIGVLAVGGVRAEVLNPLPPVLLVALRQAAYPQLAAYLYRLREELLTLARRQCAEKEEVGALTVVNQHIEHVAVCPLGYRVATSALDTSVRMVYIADGTGARYSIAEDHRLGEAHGLEKALDGPVG